MAEHCVWGVGVAFYILCVVQDIPLYLLAQHKFLGRESRLWFEKADKIYKRIQISLPSAGWPAAFMMPRPSRTLATPT